MLLRKVRNEEKEDDDKDEDKDEDEGDEDEKYAPGSKAKKTTVKEKRAKPTITKSKKTTKTKTTITKNKLHKDWPKPPSISLEKSRNQIMCRSGKSGRGTTQAFKFKDKPSHERAWEQAQS